MATSLETPAWAAVGPATRAILEAEGVEVDVQPTTSTSVELARSIPVRIGSRVLLIRGDLADEALPAELRAQGADVTEVVAYRTLEAPASSRTILREAVRDGSPTVVILTSGSSARGLLALAEADGIDPHGMSAVCIGPVTAHEADRLGFRVVAVATATDATTLAQTTAAAIASTLETP
jgi:uroporphyrinogen-III synthase